MPEKQEWCNLLMATAYLPPVSYIAWIEHASKIQIEIYETYPKQTWRNRCTIAGANGPLDLSIPIEKPLGNHTPTGMVNTSLHTQWKNQHWRSILSAYRKSAFFIHYSEILEHHFLSTHAGSLLIDWNMSLLQSVLMAIGIKTPIQFSDEYVKAPIGITDLRNALSPKKVEPAAHTDKIFLPYFQGFSDKHGFLPNLSIIDVLFNLGPDTLQYVRDCGFRQLNCVPPCNHPIDS